MIGTVDTRVRVRPNPWIRSFGRWPEPRVRLFCFPYAGGGTAVFRGWADQLPAWVELCSIALPGREDRLREAPFECLPPLIDALSEAILPHLDKPFAFFGHSLGAIIAFELARQLRRMQRSHPLILLASGRRAPQLQPHRSSIHNLPDEAFRQELRRLNGTSSEVLHDEELMKLVLPCVRADFAISEEYSYAPEAPLECPISVYGGHDDRDVGAEQLSAWRSQSRVAFKKQRFAGDHFFLHTARRALLQAISEDLALLLTLNGQTDTVPPEPGSAWLSAPAEKVVSCVGGQQVSKRINHL